MTQLIYLQRNIDGTTTPVEFDNEEAMLIHAMAHHKALTAQYEANLKQRQSIDFWLAGCGVLAVLGVLLATFVVATS